MHHRITFVLAAMLATAIALPRANGAQTPQAWMKENAGLSNADVVSIYTILLNQQLRAKIAKGDDVIEDVEFILFDSKGRTVVDLLLKEREIADLQRMPPGQQTAEFQKLHAKFAGLLAGDTSGGAGLFDEHEKPVTSFREKLRSFLKERRPEDFVMFVGFKKSGKNHVYAVVEKDRVEFRTDAPTASK